MKIKFIPQMCRSNIYQYGGMVTSMIHTIQLIELIFCGLKFFKVVHNHTSMVWYYIYKDTTIPNRSTI